MRRPIPTAVRFLLAASGAFLLAPHLEGQEKARYQVIVHAASPASSLTRDQLSRFFLKKATAWEDGRTVTPADLFEASPVRVAFSMEVHRKSVAAVKAYWQQRIFSGSDVPPPEFAADSEVLTYVRARPGAIAYVSAGAELAGVKAVQVRE